ncbi:hypothetical protein CFP56_032830 [Quercus suber]|uniref:Uncharacterized protein n=1 Tax=Quercus suber TaxID=58331 RepID=A0AAW0LRM5_QUESU
MTATCSSCRSHRTTRQPLPPHRSHRIATAADLCTPFMGSQVKTERCCLLSICNIITVRDFRYSTVLKLNLCIPKA